MQGNPLSLALLCIITSSTETLLIALLMTQMLKEVCFRTRQELDNWLLYWLYKVNHLNCFKFSIYFNSFSTKLFLYCIVSSTYNSVEHFEPRSGTVYPFGLNIDDL